MKTGLTILKSVDVNLRSQKINLAPSQLYCLANSQTVAITGQHQGVIPHRSAGYFGSGYQLLYLIGSEIFSWASLKVRKFGHNFQKGEWGTL
jgi:hypothetical protein